MLQGTKLPLTIWFMAIYLISQAKTGLPALALKRQLEVSYPTAWLIHHKLMQVMAEREDRYVLGGKVQIDDVYLGGERTGGKVGRGSENKVPFVTAVSLSDDGRPLRIKLTPVSGFTLKAISVSAKDHLDPASVVFSDGLACLGAVTEAGCSRHPTVMAGRKPKDVPEFKWINTILGNLKTSLSGAYHAFDFRKYAARYLAAFCYRFNRRFDLRTLHQRLLIAAAGRAPQPLRSIQLADVHCQSGQKLAGFQEEIQFEVLCRLHQTPQVSQRALAKDLGVGLGTINFCFQVLVEKSLVKMRNSGQSKNKLRYAYLLTPDGVAEKSKLTAEFLKRKVAEYETLQAEIEVLKVDMNSVKVAPQ